MWKLRPVLRALRKRIKNPRDLHAGDRHYRSYVGPPGRYRRMGAAQLELMMHAGLCPHHRLLDIGCGSLRGGRKLVPYLDEGNYFGLEPNRWLVEAGIEKVLGRRVYRRKRPQFAHDDDFTLTLFEQRFDFMLAQSIFSHATAVQIDRCLSQAAQVLTPDGVLLANFQEGTTDYAGTEWVYPDCCHYTFAFFQRTAARHGLRCERHETPASWPNPLAMLRFTRSRSHAEAHA